MKIVLFSIVCMLFLVDDAVSESSTDQRHDCTIGKAPQPEKLVALKGWPYVLDCSMFLESEDYYLYDLYDNYGFDPDDVTLCEIRDGSGNLLLNSSTSFDLLQYNSQDGDKVVLANPQNGDNLNFNLTVKIPTIDKCITMKIQLQLKDLEEESCEKFLKEQEPQKPFKSNLGSLKTFTCDVPTGVYPKGLSVRDTSGLTFKWMHNCGELPSGISLNDDNSTLTIPSLTFEHGGTYSCAVSYKGMTRNLFSTSVCVQHGLTYTEPIMTCQSQRYFQKLGDDVNVRCTGNFGFGVIAASTFSFRWEYQQENSTDVIFCRKQTALNGIMTSKSSCTYKLPEEACFLNPPPASDASPKAALVEVVLTMRNLRPSDFGMYQSILSVNVVGSSPVLTNVIISEKTQGSSPVLTNVIIGETTQGTEPHLLSPSSPVGFTVGEIVGVSMGIAAAGLLVIVLVFAWLQYTANSSTKLENEKDEENKDFKV